MKRILNHIKHFIYKRKELKRLKLCLEVIENAKDYYTTKGFNKGMCNAFYMVLYDIHIHINYMPYGQWLGINIPEFNPKYLTGLGASYNEYWWNVNDIDSRIEAFNKLINLYETKIKELC